ncbi:MAG: VanZ family protein [Betaproteobacteria bacterium]|nr:VanZ family protein [Betaproteobacteria bacterium]
MPRDRPSSLARFLLVAYVLLVVYATLYPFAGWRDAGGSAFAYLSAAWPRYFTHFDVAANVLAYLPYGALAVLAMHPVARGGVAVSAALISGAALTVLLEGAQSYLPARVASNLDVLCNLAGTLAGALLGVRHADWLFDTGPLQRLRAAWVLPGAQADAGLVLLGLWLLTQLDPTSLLFGAGDLRDLFQHPAGAAYAADVFVTIEAWTAACNLIAVGLAASAILAPGVARRLPLLALLALALAVKTAAFVILRQANGVFDWLTPGALIGLAVGTPLLLAAAGLPRALRLALAALLLMGATVLVNLAPPNPYLVNMLKVWSQGHFLNFNGLTHLLSSAWPFAAIVYLMFLAARGTGARPGKMPP